MKIAICDDEKDIRNYIEKCVHEIAPQSETIQYEDGRDILRPDFDADILFLDIQMPGMDGMKAARILRTTHTMSTHDQNISGGSLNQHFSKPVIVFVTAVEEYVFQAFDVGAVRYIVKPFEKSRLLDTIRQALAIAEDQRSISDFLSAGVDDRDKPRYITVKSGGVNTRVILTDIVYAEVFDRRVVLHMQDRECIEYYGRMTELERVAGSDFFRPHRAYLINLRFVSSYDSRTVCVQGTVIPVARGKYRELVRAYMSYVTDDIARSGISTRTQENPDECKP